MSEPRADGLHVLKGEDSFGPGVADVHYAAGVASDMPAWVVRKWDSMPPRPTHVPAPLHLHIPRLVTYGAGPPRLSPQKNANLILTCS
jgi:hypothetical protein